jgi:hypothetical protein
MPDSTRWRLSADRWKDKRCGEDVVRDLCLPSRGSSSTSADAVAHRDLSYSWDRGGQVVSDRDNRDSPQPQLLGVAGKRNGLQQGRDHRSPVAWFPPLLPGAIFEARLVVFRRVSDVEVCKRLLTYINAAPLHRSRLKLARQGSPLLELNNAMSIATAVQKGGYIHVCDERGTLLCSVQAMNGLAGYTSSTVSVKGPGGYMPHF